MSATRIIGLLSTVVGFFVFAFRKGLRVKPEDRANSGPSVGTGNDHADGDGGHQSF
jgi:hypothetical protein